MLNALSYLRKRIGVEVAVDGGELVLRLPLPGGGFRVLNEGQRSDVVKAMHDAKGAVAFVEWQALANQGKAANPYPAEPRALGAFDRF